MKIAFEINQSIMALIRWYDASISAKIEYHQEYGDASTIKLKELVDHVSSTYNLYSNMYNHAKVYSPNELPSKPLMHLDNEQMDALNNLYEMVNSK